MDELREQESEVELNGAQPFDWDDAARILGASEKQVAFAKAIVRGMNQTQAARAAGYAGDDEQIRSAGYSAMQSAKVRSLIAWAKEEGAAPLIEIADAETLKRKLSQIVNGGAPSEAIRASEVLHRIHQSEVANAPENHDPVATLNQIAAIDPALAFALARKNQITWQPTAEQQTAINAALRHCINCGRELNGNGRAEPRPEQKQQAGGYSANASAQPDAAAADNARGEDENADKIRTLLNRKHPETQEAAALSCWRGNAIAAGAKP